MVQNYSEFVDRIVVLDTDGPILYVGTLAEVRDHVFVLLDADVHDCREGHATKESYLVLASQDGVAINRRKVLVMQRAVISLSLLSDVVDA